MQEIIDDLARLANCGKPIAVRGEVGAGKTLLARCIHQAGPRRGRPFLTLNCLELREDQFEKKIFGDSRGSARSTPAQGLWCGARNGTLFLRSANMLPQEIGQRVRQQVETDTKRSAPHLIVSLAEKFLGEARPEPSKWVDQSFACVHVPPLREHRDDIPLLVQHFLKIFNTDKRRIDRVAPQAMDIMQRYSWPGNVRELRNTVKRALEVGHTFRLSVSDLPTYIVEATEQTINRNESLRSLHTIEKKAILETLHLVRGDKARAAEILKIDRSTLYRKLRHYGLR
jgi:DNA-binding NtrC family response regulator